MFPWELVDGLWATNREGVGLIVRAIRFQDFQPIWSQFTNVTDGQSDRRTACDRKTTLCTIVHRAVKSLWRKQTSRKSLLKEIILSCIHLYFYN